MTLEVAPGRLAEHQDAFGLERIGYLTKQRSIEKEGG